MPSIPKPAYDLTTYKFTNCRLVRNGLIVTDDLWVRNGKIINPEPVFFEEKKREDVSVDCKGALICPGFIDVQINGGFGYDFTSDSDRLEEALSVVGKSILAHGVTSYCPTIVTSAPETYKQVLPRISKTPGGKHGAGILGIHLEGPFISPEKKGAHPLQHIRDVTDGINSIEEVYGSLSDVAMITMAPELPGAPDVIKDLRKKNIVISVGHSNGNLEDGEAAVNSGASFITHLFNAMLPFHHRDPGLVGLLTSKVINDPIYYGIISDGIHTHPAALRIAHRTHPKGLVLVTDAMSAMGLNEGHHVLGCLEVEVKDRKVVLRGTNTIAGSVATMDDCVQHFIKAAGITIVEAIEAASLHPAKAMGINHLKGSLDFDTDADFLLLDDTSCIKVNHTFIAGQCVYSHDQAPALTFSRKKRERE